jgi:hypothetical protein
MIKSKKLTIKGKLDVIVFGEIERQLILRTSHILEHIIISLPFGKFVYDFSMSIVRGVMLWIP